MVRPNPVTLWVRVKIVGFSYFEFVVAPPPASRGRLFFLAARRCWISSNHLSYTSRALRSGRSSWSSTGATVCRSPPANESFQAPTASSADPSRSASFAAGPPRKEFLELTSSHGVLD